MWSVVGALWVAGGCIRGICWGCVVRWWARHANVSAGCSLMLIDVHWGMSVYTGSHCVALDHNLVGSLVCIAVFIVHLGICWGEGRHVGGLCMVVCIVSFFVFIFCFFWCVLWLCFWLFTGPPSTLDYVLRYLFCFIWLGF